jgi:hypothetical protein
MVHIYSILLLPVLFAHPRRLMSPPGGEGSGEKTGKGLRAGWKQGSKGKEVMSEEWKEIAHNDRYQ